MNQVNEETEFSATLTDSLSSIEYFISQNYLFPKATH